MTARQIPLDLAYPPALGAKDFVVGAANRDAFAWIERWPEWPGNALALFGPAGSGKTHLAELWRARSGALILDAPPHEDNFPDSALILEAPSRWPEVALLHLLNRQREAGNFLLVLDREAPARWAVGLPDLASRLAAMPAIGLAAPDDELLVAVMAKHFADRNQSVGDEALRYLAQRIERSFAAAAQIVATIDRRALAQNRRVTLALIREALAAAEEPL
jgi:chromosomal replication initiation ATPase DnaA